MSRKKILWLASWYPSRIAPFNGDFIQRHAQAVSLYHDVTVLYVVRDEKSVVTKDILTEKTTVGNLTEHRLYYSVGNVPALFQKIVSQLRYHQLFKKAIRRYINENGTPDLVHVHVTLKAGLLAAWMKKKYGIPYVVTEHWTGYLPEAEDYFKKRPAYFQWLCTRIWSGAAAVSAVSQYLYGHLKKLIPDKEVCVIPNVVNTDIFQPELFQNPISYTSFIHVSGLSHQKNAEAILQAFAQVKEKSVPFQLHIIGPQCPSLMQLVQNLRLDTNVFFHSEVSQPQLAEQMHQAHALILYSRYETFGCVVIEANACGLPVIVSDIPTMHELVEEGVNGIFVPGENAAALAERLIWFINNRNSFDASHIARNTQERYNYKTVGLQFSNWYDSVLKNHKT